MVGQSNTVCRNVRRKPAHSVEHKGFRIFGWSLPAPCKLPQREKTRQKAKTTPVSREERGWRSSSKSMLHLQMSNVCQILFRPTALLFIPHTTLLTATLCALLGRQPCLESGSSCLSAQSEAWGAIRAVGLTDHMVVWTNWFQWLLRTHTSWPNNSTRKIRIHYKTFCRPSWFCRHYNSPVLALIVLRRLFWRSTTQNPPSGFCILCLSLGQRLHLLSGTRRGSGVSCVAVICRAL